jgi:hypothetical protein
MMKNLIDKLNLIDLTNAYGMSTFLRILVINLESQIPIIALSLAETRYFSFRTLPNLSDLDTAQKPGFIPDDTSRPYHQTC